MSLNFRTRTGRLTSYTFACGYIEEKSTDFDNFRSADLYTCLFHEGGCWRVEQFDRRPGTERLLVFSMAFDTITEAQRVFDKQPGKLKNSP